MLRSIRAAKLPRIIAGVAAVVFVATATFHSTGYADVSKAVSIPGVPAFLRRTSPGLWLFFAWHLVALAAAAAWAALSASFSARPLLMFCTAAVAADTAFVLFQAGLFADTWMLAGAVLCLLFASLRWPCS